MNKKARILIPTVLIKEASFASVMSEGADLLKASPLGSIKPLNPLHGAGVGALAGGSIALGSQYLTAEGRKRSFREKLRRALIPTAAGAGAGAILSDTLRNRALADTPTEFYKTDSSGNKTVINNPHMNKEMYGIMKNYFTNKSVRSILDPYSQNPVDLEFDASLKNLVDKYNPTPTEKAK